MATTPRALRRRRPFAAYVLRRLAAAFVTVVVATALVFAAIQVLPGNVAEIVLGRNATPQRTAEVRADLKLDAPLVSRYVHYVRAFVTGDFGNSTAGLVQGVHTSVSGMVGPALTNSIVLAAIVMVLFVPLTLLLGVWAGVSAGRASDHAISTSTLAISALPEFLVGTLLIYVLFTKLGVFAPVSAIPAGDSPLSHPNLLILPVLTLLLVSLAFGARLLRAAVAEVIGHDYVTMARLNGYPTRRIIARYVLPNAISSTIQIYAQQLQYLIGGIVIVENVFNYPGIGNVLVRAISVRDVQVVMVTTTILAAAYIVINVVADIACVAVDPRVRTTLA